eukprot:142639_1
MRLINTLILSLTCVFGDIGDYIGIPDGIYSFQTTYFQDIHDKGYIYVSPGKEKKEHKYSPQVTSYAPTDFTMSSMDNSILFKVKKVQQNDIWYHLINLMYLDDEPNITYTWYMDAGQQPELPDTIFMKPDLPGLYSQWAFISREKNKFEIVSKKSIDKCLALSIYLDSCINSVDCEFAKLKLMDKPDQFNNSMLWYINPIYFNIINEYQTNQLFHANFKQLEMEHAQLKQLNIQYKNKWIKLFVECFVNKTITIQNTQQPFRYSTIALGRKEFQGDGVIQLSGIGYPLSWTQLKIVQTQWSDKFAIQSNVFPDYYISASENGDVWAKNIKTQKSQLRKNEAFGIEFEIMFNDDLPNNIFNFNKQKILFSTEHGTHLKVTNHPKYDYMLKETPLKLIQEDTFWRHSNKNTFIFIIKPMEQTREIPIFMNPILTENSLVIKQHQPLSNSMQQINYRLDSLVIKQHQPLSNSMQQINYRLDSLIIKQHQPLSNSMQQINYRLDSLIIKQHQPLSNSVQQINHTLDSLESPKTQWVYVENICAYVLCLVIIILIIVWQIHCCNKCGKAVTTQNNHQPTSDKK